MKSIDSKYLRGLLHYVSDWAHAGLHPSTIMCPHGPGPPAFCVKQRKAGSGLGTRQQIICMLDNIESAGTRDTATDYVHAR